MSKLNFTISEGLCKRLCIIMPWNLNSAHLKITFYLILFSRKNFILGKKIIIKNFFFMVFQKHSSLFCISMLSENCYMKLYFYVIECIDIRCWTKQEKVFPKIYCVFNWRYFVDVVERKALQPPVCFLFLNCVAILQFQYIEKTLWNRGSRYILSATFKKNS